MRYMLATLSLSTLLFAGQALALDGVNLDTGDAITVDDATVFTVGDVISVFDDEGNELGVTIQTVKDTGATWAVDVQDQDSGDTVSLEFPKK